eukprot:jgi/Ulvmu1/5373/UM022_0168.1
MGNMVMERTEGSSALLNHIEVYNDHKQQTTPLQSSQGGICIAIGLVNLLTATDINEITTSGSNHLGLSSGAQAPSVEEHLNKGLSRGSGVRSSSAPGGSRCL